MQASRSLEAGRWASDGFPACSAFASDLMAKYVAREPEDAANLLRVWSDQCTDAEARPQACVLHGVNGGARGVVSLRVG